MAVTLTNNNIYNYTNLLLQNFQDGTIKLPVQVNFYLQKNMTELIGLAQEIEKKRLEIMQEFGTPNDETQQYDIPEDKIPEAAKKLNELFGATQKVKIYKIKLDALGDLELTANQMQALLFMIEEE